MKRKPQDEFQKKRALRRKKIRRRRILATFIVLLVSAAVTFAVLSVTVLFPVKTVTVSGESRYSREEIIESSGLDSEDNIIVFSSEKVIKAINTSLPYTGDIEIKRQFPDTVNIKIKNERREYAVVYSDGGYYAVSEEFFVLNKYPECPANLFLVKCENVECREGYFVEFADKKLQDRIQEFVFSLIENDISVNYAEIKSSAELRAAVEGRFLVDFGSISDIDRKCAHLSATIKSMNQQETGRIDLSMWNEESKEIAFFPGDVDLSSGIGPQTDTNDVETDKNTDKNDPITDLE